MPRGGPEELAERLDVRHVSRPVVSDGPREFDLAYVRTGPRSDRPVLFIPGGPGLGSVLPYRGLRKDAAARHLDVLMVEHRGVGFSRHDRDGTDLPPDALSVVQAVDDIAAVLDDAGVERAVVYGSSYGSYLAQVFGIRHPGRVAGMVLDSPMLGAHDGGVVRDHLRSLLWDGSSPDTVAAAAQMRAAVEAGVVPVDQTTAVAQPVYEFAGPRTLERLLALRLAGRGQQIWDRVVALGGREISTVHRYVMEFDLVGVIAFRELGYAPDPDGGPLDRDLTFAAAADRYPSFAGETYDLPSHLPEAAWPIAVVSGERDLRTPRPIANRIVDLAPDAVLVPLANTGHSALDTHRLAALHVAHAVQVGGHAALPRLADRIAELPRRGMSHLLGPAVTAAVRAEELLPRRVA